MPNLLFKLTKEALTQLREEAHLHKEEDPLIEEEENLLQTDVKSPEEREMIVNANVIVSIEESAIEEGAEVEAAVVVLKVQVVVEVKARVVIEEPKTKKTLKIEDDLSPEDKTIEEERVRADPVPDQVLLQVVQVDRAVDLDLAQVDLVLKRDNRIFLFLDSKFLVDNHAKNNFKCMTFKVCVVRKIQYDPFLLNPKKYF